VENQNCLITSSTDCTVRLWTLDGHFIGTFGQPLKWDIYDSSSYQHPMAPYDVLVDPERRRRVWWRANKTKAIK